MSGYRGTTGPNSFHLRLQVSYQFSSRERNNQLKSRRGGMVSKYRRYSDDFIAGSVLMYQATPNFQRVAKELKIPESTLRGWVNRQLANEKLPQGADVPANVHADKKTDFVARLGNLLNLHIDEAGKTVTKADHYHIIGGIKIVTEAMQLLKGEPTQRIAADSTHHITKDVDRSEYDDVIREAEDIISEAASGA